MKVRTVTGSEFELPDFEVEHPRARHIMRSALLKRHLLAQAYRQLLEDTTGAERAEIRRNINEMRRARKGWAA